MRPVSSVLRPLVLAVVCLFAAASVAEANPRRRAAQPVIRYYPPTPTYSPGVRVSPSVYIYPQISTVPRYYPIYPYYSAYPYAAPVYGSPYYGPAGGSWYPPAYRYASPYYSGGYPSTGFSFWFRIR